MDNDTWQVKKVRRAGYSVDNTFDVHVKNGLGEKQVWVVMAYDELDAWRNAEEYIMENHIGNFKVKEMVYDRTKDNFSPRY
jgi:hypothetical protein